MHPSLPRVLEGRRASTYSAEMGLGCVIHASSACLPWEEPTLLGKGSNCSLSTKRSPETLGMFPKTEQ